MLCIFRRSSKKKQECEIILDQPLLSERLENGNKKGGSGFVLEIDEKPTLLDESIANKCNL
jgi:hypothetical protein